MEIILVRFRGIHNGIRWCLEVHAYILCLCMVNFQQYLIHSFYANHFPVLACIARDILAIQESAYPSSVCSPAANMHSWMCNPHYQLSLHQRWTILMMFVLTANTITIWLNIDMYWIQYNYITYSIQYTIWHAQYDMITIQYGKKCIVIVFGQP